MTFLRSLTLRGLPTNVGSAAALGFIGDVMCQLGPDRRSLPPLSEMRWRKNGDPPHDESQFDPRRLVSITAFNAAYIGGFLHFLYQTYPIAVSAVTSRVLPLPSPLRAKLLDERTLAHAFGCSICDTVHNGSIYIPAYFIGVGLLQGDPLSEALAALKREWTETVVFCTGFWLPFMWANFSLVPPAGRVRAMATANLGWCVVIDYLAHRGE